MAGRGILSASKFLSDDQLFALINKIIYNLQYIAPYLSKDIGEVAPDNPMEGMVAYANGSAWNPGEGQGYYFYTGSAWKKLVSITDKFGSATNYSIFEADGTLQAFGDGTCFRDELGDVAKLKVVGVGITADDTESAYDFLTSANLSDYLWTNVQLNHDMKAGANIKPHIHFFQTNNAAPNFLIQYRWQKNGGAKTTSWTNYKCNTLVYTYTSGTLNQIAYGAAITPPVGYNLSDILQVRVLRDNANTSTVFAGADPYTGSASVTSVDVHIEIDMLGSRSEYAK